MSAVLTSLINMELGFAMVCILGLGSVRGLSEREPYSPRTACQGRPGGGGERGALFVPGLVDRRRKVQGLGIKGLVVDQLAGDFGLQIIAPSL